MRTPLSQTNKCIQCRNLYVTIKDSQICGSCQRKKAKQAERDAQLAELLRRCVVAAQEDGDAPKM